VLSSHVLIATGFDATTGVSLRGAVSGQGCNPGGEDKTEAPGRADEKSTNLSLYGMKPL